MQNASPRFDRRSDPPQGMAQDLRRRRSLPVRAVVPAAALLACGLVGAAGWTDLRHQGLARIAAHAATQRGLVLEAALHAGTLGGPGGALSDPGAVALPGPGAVALPGPGAVALPGPGAVALLGPGAVAPGTDPTAAHRAASLLGDALARLDAELARPGRGTAPGHAVAVPALPALGGFEAATTALGPRLHGFIDTARAILDGGLTEPHRAAAALQWEAADLAGLLDTAQARTGAEADAVAATARGLHLGAAALLVALLGGVAGGLVRPLRRQTRALQARLATVTTTDRLTGLLNRDGFTDRLGALLAEVRDGQHLALVLVDLDGFTEANAAQGHAAGDALLRAASARLANALRTGDAIGRLSGDEFAIAAPMLPDPAAATMLARRLRAALCAGPVGHAGRELRLGATLGVAVAPDAAAAPDGAEALLRAAGTALARAKRGERDTLAVFSATERSRAEREVAVLRGLDEGLRQGGSLPGLHAALQPQIRMADGALVGLEALARWNHPRLGPLSPADFLPVAERAGHMVALGTAIRASAFAAFAALRAAALIPAAPPPRLAVNLSAAELADEDCVAGLERALAEAGLSPEALEIEITEEVLLDRMAPELHDRLAALRGRGARLALDDFGTGYAGLNQLLRLPLDVVKLDRCFVRGLGTDRRAEEIVRASVALAHSLGMELLAEGVETAEQLARLRDLGCDAVQGYLLARPMPADELPGWVARRRTVETGSAKPSGGAGIVALHRREWPLPVAAEAG